MRRTLVLASLFAAVAACDDSDPAITDAREIDATANDCGCTADTPQATVRVVVFDIAAPVAGVPVYFLDSAGTLITVADTDAAGEATAEMPTGGSVTALVPDGGFAPHLATALGVQAGDVIGVRAPGGGTDMTIDLTFPANGSDSHYAIRSACGSADVLVEPGSTVTTQVQLWGCPSRTDFVISADNGDGGPVSTFVAGDIAVNDGGAITVTGTYVDDVDVETTYTNLGNVGVIQIDRTTLTGPWVLGATWNTVDVVGGTGTATLSAPVFTAPSRGAVIASGRVYRSNSVAEVHERADGDYTLDTTGLFLPAFVQGPDFDTATRTLTWGEAATGAAPDATLVELEISRPSQKASWRWVVVAPHDGTSLQLPLLPGAAAEWNPVATDGSWVQDHLTAKVPGGYRAAIAYGLTSFDTVALGAGGRSVVERRQLATAHRHPR